MYVLRLADGSTFVVAGTEESAWDRGFEMLTKGCLTSQSKALNRPVSVAAE